MVVCGSVSACVDGQMANGCMNGWPDGQTDGHCQAQAWKFHHSRPDFGSMECPTACRAVSGNHTAIVWEMTGG